MSERNHKKNLLFIISVFSDRWLRYADILSNKYVILGEDAVCTFVELFKPPNTEKLTETCHRKAEPDNYWKLKQERETKRKIVNWLSDTKKRKAVYLIKHTKVCTK